MARLIKLAAWTRRNLASKCMVLACLGAIGFLIGLGFDIASLHSIGAASLIIAAVPAAFEAIVAMLPWE